ncbi:hypothetical protein [Leuconostoc rapi]|uniref:hypothetical protein n=1 Tax=Leuconostoc rapi TaxID=1406906 RepID=UPI0019590CB9|nr:hypothetical protein [Leuconostoc rapi]MBM7434917.1 hypothetical protein [Leuconostoc rapi]
MQTLSIPPEKLLTVLLGKPIDIAVDYTGLLLLAAEKNTKNNLPSEMAGGIVYYDHQKITFVSLVHPFTIPTKSGIFTTLDTKIHREPYNWFGPQSLIIEKKLADFSKNYDGPLTETGDIPRALIPNNIAEPVILSDRYWLDYTTFVNDPDGLFASQIKPLFRQQK